jgi:hypothetical protein
MQLLREFKEQGARGGGGDINSLTKHDHLEKQADGSIKVVKKSGQVRDDIVGCWLLTNRKNWKKGKNDETRWNCISKERVEMLEALGFIWVVDFSKEKYIKVKDSPHYQLLLEYSKAGNDVNGLNTSQNPVKTEDGWMNVNALQSRKKRSRLERG